MAWRLTVFVIPAKRRVLFAVVTPALLYALIVSDYVGESGVMAHLAALVGHRFISKIPRFQTLRAANRVSIRVRLSDQFFEVVRHSLTPPAADRQLSALRPRAPLRTDPSCN